MQGPGLSRDLTGRGQVGQGTHLDRVRRLILQQLTLQGVDFDLTVGLDHRTSKSQGEGENDDHG